MTATVMNSLKERLSCRVRPVCLTNAFSPGTENARRDRVAKRQLYGKHGVKEYWVADPENRSLEVYRLKRRTLALVNTHIADDELTSSVLPDFRCAVSQLFI
jgi:Uma2 family endonuclease